MLPESYLRTTYGLTAAEARLVLHILTGQSLRAIAKTLGITYETARSRLKSAFHKTGTHRQSELVAMLARTALSFQAKAEKPRTRRSGE